MKVIRTTAIFKCVVTFKNGTHKILRMTIDLVAKMTYQFRECKRSIFRNEFVLMYIGDDFLNLTDIKQAKFINERTSEEYLTLA